MCDCCYVPRHSQTLQAMSEKGTKSMLKQEMGVYLGFTWVGNLVIKVAPSVNMAVSPHVFELGKLGRTL